MIQKYNYIDVRKNKISLSGKKVIIWGRSISALNLYIELKAENVNIIGFTDSFVDSENDKFAGLPVFSYEKIQDMGEIVIYISTQNIVYQREILQYIQGLKNAVVLCKGTVYGPGQYDIMKMKKMMEKESEEIQFVRSSLQDQKSVFTFDNLLKYRVSNEKKLIEDVYEKGHKQYFPENEILTQFSDEIFVDAGGYIGETSCDFSKWTNGQYKKIYIMEPDEIMFHVLEEYIKLMKLHDVIAVNRGAYSCTTELKFNSDILLASSGINEDGTDIIQTISIDEMLNGEKATFIKMDIEGAEMEALKGAEKTIMEFKPKLAISIYHKDNDLWKIPYYIRKKYPWYKLYIRHYTSLTTETVLYATI